MPDWLQTLMGIVLTASLGWMGWLTILAMRLNSKVATHDQKFDNIDERCHGREDWIRSLSNDNTELAKKVGRIDKNIIRLGMNSGLDRGELEREGE